MSIPIPLPESTLAEVAAIHSAAQRFTDYMISAENIHSAQTHQASVDALIADTNEETIASFERLLATRKGRLDTLMDFARGRLGHGEQYQARLAAVLTEPLNALISDLEADTSSAGDSAAALEVARDILAKLSGPPCHWTILAALGFPFVSMNDSPIRQ